jgi:hypothetical protein
MSFVNASGGCRIEYVWMLSCFEGGDAGGVTGVRVWEGAGPGEHIGMCLFGTGVGLLGTTVFRLRDG